ncbi:hypothetical protein GCM10009535_49240 [Streptomyces thermocarboxydovorans]|uniref:Secreted protein n=1 Tax=Streptomyces thermocarboxydovorans TaxID=59298 RepID=A0ABP3T453_9ACTN
MNTTLIAVGCGVVALAVGYVIGVLSTKQAVRDCEAQLEDFLAHWVKTGLTEEFPDYD